MKRILSALTLLGLLALPLVGVAQTEVVPELTGQEMLDALDRIVDWLFTILLVIAAIAVVIAAYYFVTAAGDPERVKLARQFVIYALIGVSVAVAARGLVALAKLIVEG